MGFVGVQWAMRKGLVALDDDFGCSNGGPCPNYCHDMVCVQGGEGNEIVSSCINRRNLKCSQVMN